MFNLFVTFGGEEVWKESGVYRLERSRFLEFTDEEISAKFSGQFSSSQTTALMRLPCLFMYEDFNGPTRIGRLKDIRPFGRNLFVTYELDNKPEIDVKSIPEFEKKIGLSEWELSRTHWAIKNVDLFSVLRNWLPATIIDREADVELEPSSMMDLPKATLPSAKAIKTVSEFIHEVLGIESEGKEIFYRGHADRINYKLAPTLFRPNSRGDPKLLLVEHKLYRELLITNPKDFRDDLTTLDRLVRMQHFGLPTRLLDITSNPLIALYFACCDLFEKEAENKTALETAGEVIIFRINPELIKYFDSDTASCMANLARISHADKEKIDYSNNLENFNNLPVVKRLLHFIKEEKPYFEPRIESNHLKSIVCVKSKRSNDRISSQSGAFLLFGQDAQFLENGMPELGISLLRFEVANKLQILKELDQLNINASTVFPNIESSARYIAERFSK